MSEPEMDQWATHLPALLACVAATKGPILECGVGIWSTPILHAVCASSQRPLVSVESKMDWFSRFTPFATSWHEVRAIENWGGVPLDPQYRGPGIAEIGWSVAFVDHGFAPRGPVVAALRGKSEFVVMHDSECGYCGYNDALAGYDWVWTHTFSPAWTTIAGIGKQPSWIEETITPGYSGLPKTYR
jgi:hypothetical protein